MTPAFPVPDTRLCPITPCLEWLEDVTRLGDAEPQGFCLAHGIFRWGEVGGWVR